MSRSDGDAEQSGEWLGARVPRREDAPLVTGHALFAADQDDPRTLHCAILRSPYAHARIRSVDCSGARHAQGVVAALSGREALAYWGELPPAMQFPGMRLPTAHGLAVDKVVFQGEPVAVVVAESRYLAEDALDQIAVEYERLPVVAGVADALGVEHGGTVESPALIYDDWGDNVQLEFVFEHGGVDDVFASAPVVVRDTFAVHRHGAMPLEPRAVFAQFDPLQKRLSVRMSVQNPHQARSTLAQTFGLPESDIKVLATNVGGGFGSKLGASAEVVPVLMSIVTGRPVKWAETRGEWLLGGPGGSRGYSHDIELALTEDGEILGVRDRLVCDVGCDSAVRAVGGGAPLVGSLYVPGPYRVPSYGVRTLMVVSNKPPYEAYRGYGKDLSNMPMERILDRAAERLGMDPVELRRRNLLDTFPHTLPSGPIIENGSFLECLDLLVETMDLPRLREEQARARMDGRHLGIGVVGRLEPSAGAIPGSIASGVESASVRLHPDGTVTAMTAIQPIGQGVETTYAQVVAHGLGTTPDQVRISFGDTDVVPFGMGSYASRGATFGVTAVFEAAKEVHRKVVLVASRLMEVDPDDISVVNGVASVRGTDRSVTLQEVAQAAYYFPGPYYMLPGEAAPTLEADYVYTNPAVRVTPDEFGRIHIYPTHGSGAAGAVVEVDPATGQVEVRRIWMVSDSGRIINPQVAEGQMIGSTVQALGGVMTEQLPYDSEGNLLVRTLSDYQLPTFLSAPVVETAHIETPSPITPLGTKGLGEGGQIGTAPVVMAAVEDALRPARVRVNSTPLTPERVLAMIEEAEATG
jgi:carbon-monoxide dehydrogenase large subunit